MQLLLVFYCVYFFVEKPGKIKEKNSKKFHKIKKTEKNEKTKKNLKQKNLKPRVLSLYYEKIHTLRSKTRLRPSVSTIQ